MDARNAVPQDARNAAQAIGAQPRQDLSPQRTPGCVAVIPAWQSRSRFILRPPLVVFVGSAQLTLC